MSVILHRGIVYCRGSIGRIVLRVETYDPLVRGRKAYTRVPGRVIVCVAVCRKPVDIKLLQSQLVGWLVGQEVMMIRCNSIIRGGPSPQPSTRSSLSFFLFLSPASSMLAKATVVKGAVKSAKAKNRKSLLLFLSLFLSSKLRKSSLTCIMSNHQARLFPFF